MRRTKLFSAVSLLLIAGYIACKKTDSLQSKPTLSPQDRFFTVSSDASKQIKTIAEALKRQNDQHPYLSFIIKRAGYPRWDKAMELSNTNVEGRSGQEEAYIAYIPFVREEEDHTNATLIVKMGFSDTTFHMLYDRQYITFGFDTTDREHWNAKDVFHIFSRFDNLIFGHTKFLIKDGRIFGFDSSARYYATIKTDDATVQRVGKSANLIEQTDCVSIYTQVPCMQQRSEVMFVCYGWTQSCTTYWIDDNNYGSGGGGSGDPSWYHDPCGGYKTPIERTTVVDSCSTDPGWTPVTSDSTTYNPYKADTVRLDTSVTNNFPCVKRVIDSLTGYTNINALAQVALNTVFGVNEKIHLSFMADSNLPRDVDGDTKPDSAYSIGADFYATIRLNSWMLNNSTQEYIAATIIHEAIHAYIDFMQYQYETGVIDSNKFKTMFPLFWPPKIAYQSSNGINYYNANEANQHQAMAANLIQIMADALSGVFPNPNTPVAMRDSLYRCLSWGGLNETKVWYNKTDTCDIIAMNTLAKDVSTKAPFTLNTPDCSKIYNYDYKTLHLKIPCR